MLYKEREREITQMYKKKFFYAHTHVQLPACDFYKSINFVIDDHRHYTDTHREKNVWKDYIMYVFMCVCVCVCEHIRACVCVILSRSTSVCYFRP